MKTMNQFTRLDGLKPGWLNIAKRCQQLARREHGGYSIVTAKVLMTQDGTPLIWTVEQIKLEPKSKCHVLLEHFS